VLTERYPSSLTLGRGSVVPASRSLLVINHMGVLARVCWTLFYRWLVVILFPF